jgi:hypothetical protein
MSPVGFGTKNHCAAEGQQQFSSPSVTLIERYTERPTSPIVQEEVPLLKRVHVSEITKILLMNFDET